MDEGRGGRQLRRGLAQLLQEEGGERRPLIHLRCGG